MQRQVDTIVGGHLHRGEHRVARMPDPAEPSGRVLRIDDPDQEVRSCRGCPHGAGRLFVTLRLESQDASQLIDQLLDRKPHFRIGAEARDRLDEVPRQVCGATDMLPEVAAEPLAWRPGSR